MVLHLHDKVFEIEDFHVKRHYAKQGSISVT